MQKDDSEIWWKNSEIQKAADATWRRVLDILVGGLWHTTQIDRYKSIISCGYILPEPDIAEADRWSTSMGKEHYPFVRTLGGVSLFDFKGFSAEKYGEKYPFSSWHEFVPFRESWQSAIWIEIDRLLANDNFISGKDLLELWEKKYAYGHRLMPQIEAAHIGKIPTSFFRRILLANKDGIEEIC